MREVYKGMERVIVRPGDVRGLGDVVEEKSVNDYGFYKAFVAESSETVDNQPVLVFRKGNRDDQEVIRLDFESFVSWYDGLNSFTVTATLVNGSGRVLVGKTLSCVVNNEVILQGRTNSRGQVRFDVPVDGPGEYNLKIEYKVSSGELVYGAVSFAHVYVGVADSLVVDSLMGEGVQESDSTGVVGTVSCRIGDEVYPVHGVPVSFYEEYTKSDIRYTGKKVVGFDDVLPLTARVSDSDGSGIPGEPVSFYEEWEYANFNLLVDDHVVDGDNANVSARLTDSDGSGISGETILFYEEYTPASVVVNAGRRVGVTDTDVVSAFIRDTDGSRVQSSGVTVSFYEVYYLMNVDVWSSNRIVGVSDETGLSARVSGVNGEGIPEIPVTFYEEFDRVFLDLACDSVVGFGDVSVWSALVRDGDGSLVRDSLVEFTEELPDDGFSLDIAYMSDDVVDDGGVVELDARVVDSDGEPVEGVYVRFIGDGLGEEVIVPMPHTPLSLSSDKDILSFVDGDSCTLTAIVLDENGTPVEDATVEFFNGSTSMGTEQTDSSGIATKTYSSTGAGDVTFKASVGMIVSEIYSIEDCVLYDSTTSDKSSDYSTYGTATITYNANEYLADLKVNTDRNSGAYIDISSMDSFEAEITFKSKSGQALGVWLANASNGVRSNSIGVEPSSSNINLKTFINGSYTGNVYSWGHTRTNYCRFVIHKENNEYTFSLYNQNDELISTTTKTYSYITTPFLVLTDGNSSSSGGGYFKNVKIKAL